MDGVLIDAKEWHFEALNKALNLFGLEISRYDHLVTYDGLPTQVKLEMLSNERGLPSSLHNFINQMKQTYTLDFIYTKCKPIFYHQYALTKLKQEGYKMTVCSNSINQSMKLMLERSDLINFFPFYLSSENVKKPKPNPEIYVKAIKKLGSNPGECLIIEDNPIGLKAAFDSGANVMEISDINEVNYTNIKNFINKLEKDND